MSTNKEQVTLVNHIGHDFMLAGNPEAIFKNNGVFDPSVPECPNVYHILDPITFFEHKNRGRYDLVIMDYRRFDVVPYTNWLSFAPVFFMAPHMFAICPDHHEFVPYKKVKE